LQVNFPGAICRPFGPQIPTLSGIVPKAGGNSAACLRASALPPDWRSIRGVTDVLIDEAWVLHGCLEKHSIKTAKNIDRIGSGIIG